MSEVLRLGHRVFRDRRISTHLCLTARAFGANKVYYSGQIDSSLENSLKKFNFPVEHVKNYKTLFKDKIIVHLTFKGVDFGSKLKKLKKRQDILIVVGGEKVPPEIHKLADFNLSVTKEPHSEVSALAIFLYELNKQKV